jgi:hypothetical protein
MSRDDLRARGASPCGQALSSIRRWMLDETREDFDSAHRCWVGPS